jgi:hypothetical protein
LEYLSEDTIKRATLAFMKTYYKFRPRNGETVIHYDLTHSSGVIVDGHLTFPKEDGTPFVATFEATSVSSSAEVLYRLQRQRLQWDAIAVGAVLTALTLFCFWVSKTWSIASTGWIFSILLTFVVFVLAYLAYQMFNRTAGRYRYIYAVEQFKRYYVDEQWIALGNDVFTDPLDPNFTELKLQCVKNGFGLLTVNKDEYVNLLITPAREEVFGRKRVALKFNETPFYQTTLQRLSTPSIERFASPFLTQMAISLVAAIGLSTLFYHSWEETAIIKVNATAYQESMKLEAIKMAQKREPDEYVYKPGDVVKSAPELKNYDATTVSNPPTVNNNVGLYVFSVVDGYISYECERIDMQGTKYVVQDLTFSNFSDAKRRIEHLKTFGLIANAISLDCTAMPNSKHDYCVYYEVIFNEEKAANSKGLEIKSELDRLHLKNDFVKIRVLNFKNF